MWLLLALATVVTATEPPSAQHAALTYLRGNADAAWEEISAVLAVSPTNAQALLLAACINLETSGPDAAKRWVTRLERSPDARSEAAVLRQLLSRRKRLPQERIEDALAKAWRAAGEPDLSASLTLLSFEPGDVVPAFDCSVEQRMTPAEHLVLVNEDKEERVKTAIASSDNPGKNPLVFNVEVLAALTPFEPVPAELQADARRVAAAVGQVVTHADPDNGYLAVAAWLASGPGSDPMTAQDLALLEDAASRPRFAVPRREMGAELKMLATRLDPAHGTLRANRAALGTSVPLYRLWQRAEATPDGPLRARAGNVLLTVAGRLACSGTLLERMLGVALAQKGAKLSASGALPDAFRADAMRFQEWYHAMTTRSKRAGTWPFAGAWRNWDPDRELEHFEAYGGPHPILTSPGLVCASPPARGADASEHNR